MARARCYPGAGASIASTIRDPEVSGKQLPSMDNFIEVLGLADVLPCGDSNEGSNNIEAAYSILHEQDSDSPRLKEIEKRNHRIL